MLLPYASDPIEVFFFIGMVATGVFYLVLKLLEYKANKDTGE